VTTMGGRWSCSQGTPLQSPWPVALPADCGVEPEEADEDGLLTPEETLVCPNAGADNCARVNSNTTRARRLSLMASMYHKNMEEWRAYSLPSASQRFVFSN